jgi:hypothetical protein
MISEAVKDTFASIRVQVQIIIIISRCIKSSLFIFHGGYRICIYQLLYNMSVATWFEFQADTYVKTKNVMSCCLECDTLVLSISKFSSKSGEKFKKVHFNKFSIIFLFWILLEFYFKFGSQIS